ncbi:hypothetical protein HAX54_038044 [Datura stramonium]|uniref:Uncharacterized protein n=1 Tax=Datura stramonium TaxID=4076 RepID=A0ABS8SHT0_DATST|nr:hypothetical protein [Datura stramonium]
MFAKVWKKGKAKVLSLLSGKYPTIQQLAAVRFCLVRPHILTLLQEFLSFIREIEIEFSILRVSGHSTGCEEARNRWILASSKVGSDESALIWFSGNEEKHLKLSHVSRIISGQRTPIFQRQPRPEKEYQSFSLIYNDRSLDLIKRKQRYGLVA